jgi:ACT domain-containing protein
MVQKYIFEPNTELCRKQLIKYKGTVLDIAEIKKNQQITILPKINQLRGEFGLLKQTINSLCEAIHEEQPRWWSEDKKYVKQQEP